MEIKKYALLEDKTIQECNEDKMHITSDNYLAMNSGMIIDKVLKTSDNILDLVEVGDLVELWFQGNESYNKWEVKNIDEKHVETSYPTITYEQYKGYSYSRKQGIKKVPMCIAIYKKQSNGDYKRYEVEA